MFISVHIRGPVQLVRRRTGEEVSNPILEFEDGGAFDDHSSEFDLRHRVIHRDPRYVEYRDIPTDFEFAATDEKLVAAAGAFGGDAHQDHRDPELEREQRRRADLDRPLGLRRLLSHMYELSMLARPARHTFIQHIDKGLAKATFKVWRGTLTIAASVQSFEGMTSHLARGGSAHKTEARLRGIGQVNPDGSVDELQLDVLLDDLPALGPLEQAELARLKGTFIQTYENGMTPEAERTWTEAHRRSAERRPEMPLMLLVALLNDLERQAMGLLGHTAPGMSLNGITLHDLLESDGRGDEEAAAEPDLDDQTRLRWLDDHTPALDIPGCAPEQLSAVNQAFRRLLAYLPKAWAPTPTPQAAH